MALMTVMREKNAHFFMGIVGDVSSKYDRRGACWRR